MTLRLDIAIVGAGIGGLTAAAGLAKAGHAVSIFDGFPAPAPVGSGLVIQPVGQRVLAHVGAVPAALCHGRPIWRMLGTEADGGRRILDVHYGPEGGTSFGLGIRRPALFEALLDAALAAGARLHAGHKVTGTRAGRLWFDNGSETDPFDLIVDAAGANSPLSPLAGQPLPFGALWSTVPWPDAAPLPANRLSQRYRRADRMVGVMPSGTRKGEDGETATIFWSLPSDGYDAWRAGGIPAWKADVAALWPDAALYFESITDVEQMTFARYSHGTLRRPVDGRVVHIGDAAHRASPQLGQGANMAMLDAHALTLACQSWPLDQALMQFARARRWHVWLYQAMSRAFTPQYQSDSRALPVLRDRVLAPLSQVPPVPRILTRLVVGDLIPPLATLEPR